MGGVTPSAAATQPDIGLVMLLAHIVRGVNQPQQHQKWKWGACPRRSSSHVCRTTGTLAQRSSKTKFCRGGYATPLLLQLGGPLPQRTGDISNSLVCCIAGSVMHGHRKCSKLCLQFGSEALN